MREQAALLGTKTKNLIEGKVETTSLDDIFSHSFLLFVPVWSYRYELFRITHKISLYPVRVGGPLAPVLETEPDFVDWLRAKLSSPETKKVIGNLLAQITS